MAVKLKSLVTNLRFWFVIALLLMAIGANVDRYIVNFVSNLNINLAPSSPPTHQEYSIGEIIELSDTKLIINSVHTSKGFQLNKPNDSMDYVMINVTIENASSRSISYSPLDFRMLSSQAPSADLTTAILDKDTTLQSGLLAPDEQLTETITFKQSYKNEEMHLLYQPNFESDPMIKINLQ